MVSVFIMLTTKGDAANKKLQSVTTINLILLSTKGSFVVISCSQNNNLCLTDGCAVNSLYHAFGKSQKHKSTCEHIKQNKILQHHYSPYVVGETTFARIMPLSPLYLWSLLLVRQVREM